MQPAKVDPATGLLIGVRQVLSPHFDARAWHAGPSEYRGRAACNDFSIGIELEGTDAIPYTEAQYDQLARVVRGLLATYPMLSPTHITGHSDIAPGRKTDPGPAFEWSRFRSLIV